MEDPQQITDDMVRDFISLCATKGYQIRKKIGDGSFGITYLGIRRERAGPGDDGSCAIKLALDNKMLHQSGVGYKVIVMELMDLSLFQYLLNQPGYCISERETREFTRQIVAGLLYIHKKGLTHRDMKPENVLMKKNPTTGKWILKIADFGFVKQSDAMTTTLGTPEYMAPDIFSGRQYGPEVDLWALGCIVYFMLNGSLHTGRIHKDKIAEFITSSASFELRDNELKSFSNESKAFVKSLLTADPAKRIKFEALSSHPFLTPSVYFTIALNMKDAIPLVYSAPIDLGQLKERPITWGHITGYISGIVSRWGYIRPGTNLVTIANGDIVDPKKPIDEALLKTDAVNVYVFVSSDTPNEVPLAMMNVIQDFNPQDVDKELLGKQGPMALQAEAAFYLKKKDMFISLLSRAGVMRAEGLRFVDELEKGCTSYVKVYLIKAVAEANAFLARMGVQETLPLLTPEGTKKMLEKTGAQDMGFMDALQQDAEVVKAVSTDPRVYAQQNRHIQPAFYRFRNQHLHALASAAKKETGSYLEVWNKISCLVGSLASIYSLSNLASDVKTSTSKDKATENVNKYMAAFNMLMCKNTTWTQTTTAGAESRMSAEDAQTTIAGLQERLRQAEERIKKLEKENENLRISLMNAEAMVSQQFNHKV